MSAAVFRQLAELPDNSVDAVVTEPPYGLADLTPNKIGATLQRWVNGERDYVPATPGHNDCDGFVPPPAVWDEALRVLKPGGHLLAFAGTRTQDILGLSIRLAGFEIRDGIGWIATDPITRTSAAETVVLARAPLEGTVAANVLTYGTGALNVDASRVVSSDRFGGGAKGSSGFVGGYQSDGWSPGNDLGRWPANVIFDEHAAAELDRQSGLRAAGAFPKKANVATGTMYEGGWGPVGRETRQTMDSGGASRFFHTVEQSNREVAVLEYLIRLITPSRGVVLDPFDYSGATRQAAFQGGFGFIGVRPDVTDPSNVSVVNESGSPR